MRVAVTGASGLVGRFVVQGLRAAGQHVIILGTGGVPWRLGEAAEVEADVLVHCAFAHVPGRYRGGEGDDPDGFRRANLDGSVRLLRGFPGRTIFLSTRAVYGDHPPGTRLTEDLELRPDTLYGEVKAAAEAEATVSLRATGVYGPGPDHKWQGMFSDFLAGRPVAPRVATEVHGADLASAVMAVLLRGQGAFNVSDLLLDRRDLLAEVAIQTGCVHPLPERADRHAVNVMDCERIRALGWAPGGWGRLIASLPALIQSVPSR
ncbi:NAD-dependent epimerase/dehydratase family protein [Falsirhodobacter sp. 20TX0035]|uniref:NAD-dependent epimerase/dehydratase family protein n=1 Tax=Falsirhodobacter sp. 20TX0035 TaxID=3022019 RepID=UPI0023307F30|nr:NAD(P)-dependent oxidoreductase [Falsirhodobacter sp. 20TX0035]MDB6453187.1 NAD(P)-dependent oxidoreductase [Falsirhodobacter sp. 20TX0035]